KLSNISFEQNGTTEEESTDDDVTVSTTYNIFSSLYKSVVSASEEEEEFRTMGGAIFADKGVDTEINGCSFSRNKSFYGGAICNKGTMKIKNCKIEANYAFYEGGGIYNSGDIDITGTTFNANISKKDGAGLFQIANKKISINNCNFKNNKSELQGGAISAINGSLDISDTKFIQNEATYNGAGIYSGSGIDVSLKDVKGTENYTGKKDSKGGFACIGGNLDIESCEISHNSSKAGGAIYMNNSSSDGRIRMHGGRIYIYDNTSIKDSSNNNIEYEKFKTIKIKGKFKKNSFVGVVPPGSKTDITEDYSDYNMDTTPETIFACDSNDFTILLDDDYPEVATKKILKATNNGYKCTVDIKVTDDADLWDFCHVIIFGKKRNGRGEEKQVYKSHDIHESVDDSDEYIKLDNIDCGNYFPTTVVVETQFGAWYTYPDWEADVGIKVNGVNCGNHHIEISEGGKTYRYTRLPIASNMYPYPVNFEATSKREIDGSEEDDGIIKLKAVDQYGVEWNMSGNNAYSIENINYPENDKVNIMDDSGLKLKVTSDLKKNHQTTYAIRFKTGNNIVPEFTQNITVRFVFPIKLKIYVEEEVVDTKKGYQGQTIEIDDIKTKEGYYISGIKSENEGASGSLVLDEITKKYSFTFGLTDGKITVTLKPIYYYIRFDKNGEDVTKTVGDKKVTYDKNFKFPKNYYIREGYKFVGWNSKPDGSGLQIEDRGTLTENLSSKKGDIIVFYAQWEKEGDEDLQGTGSLISDGHTALFVGGILLLLSLIACVVKLFNRRKKAVS
nr:InlB B-repeat-containing protein [Lachnospiraceae bacterium]